METINYKNINRINNPHGIDARMLHVNNDVQVVHIHLKPGESLKKHSTPVNVFFYVLQGDGIVEIGDEKQKVTKDMLIDSPQNISHCLYNESNNDFRVLVVKTPKPNNEQNKQAIQNTLNA